MRRDTIFYQLFAQFPALLFDLIPNPPADPTGYTFDSVEVKETSFRIDGVFLPPDNRGNVYFCVGVACRRHSSVPARQPPLRADE